MNKISKKYNQIYSDNKNVFRGGTPENIVKDILKYKKSGSVLELGTGEGRNALFLASRGFQVTAIDISNQGIANLQDKAKELGVTINAQVKDIENFKIESDFDVFISTYVFHHLRRPNVAQLIQSMQDHTKTGGFHAIAAFTKDGDFYRNDPETDKFYLNPGELQKLYAGWETLNYAERENKALATRPDGSPMVNIAAKILARK